MKRDEYKMTQQVDTTNYKEKYEQALERAKKGECIENIFPELRESEDEQHRKWILEYLYDGLQKSDEQFKDQFNSAIAWLEKQGEQELDIRYSILDKLIEADDIYQMSVNDAMICEARNKAISALSKLEIYKSLGFEKNVEQKPVEWNEEDTANLNRIALILLDASEVKEWWKEYRLIEKDEMEKLTSWLKSINYKVQPQPKQEWSEEDERTYSEILDFFLGDIETRCATIDKQRHFGYWLKSIKPQKHWKPSEEQLRAIINSAQGLYQCKEKEVLLDLYEQLKNL